MTFGLLLLKQVNDFMLQLREYEFWCFIWVYFLVLIHPHFANKITS